MNSAFIEDDPKEQEEERKIEKYWNDEVENLDVGVETNVNDINSFIKYFGESGLKSPSVASKSKGPLF